MDFDYDRLYVLGERFTRGAIRVHAVDEIPDRVGLTQGRVELEAPLRFRWDQGSRLYDLVGTTWATLTIVSERFIALLSEGGFSGWATYPVELRHKDGTPLHGYYGLAATGRCGPIENELSPIEVLPPPVPDGEAMPHYIGLRFRLDTWDGSDCFSPEGTAFVFVTERVRDALVEAKISNIDLRRLSDVHRFVGEDD